MKKLTFGLLVALSTTVALSGCALYFGDDHHHGGNTWTYCGSDGYYTCQGDNCQWAGSTCPDQGTGSGSAGGFECRTNADCAAGCYCANGKCEEAGFCTQDSDCGAGYHCDVQRSSCEPNPPQTTCGADADCPQGQVCTNSVCTATCVCSTDAEAKAQGFDYCDEWRVTCMSGVDPAGTCGGEPDATCNIVPPHCQPGDVPLLSNGCWNGECEAATQCAVPPSCAHIQDENTCLSQSGCAEIVNGINCKKSDGTACQAGDSGCTCDSYVYAGCRSAAP